MRERELTLGEFRAPLIPCHIPPPTAPIANAPPKSFNMTHGLYKIITWTGQIIGLLRTMDLLCGQHETW